MSRYLELAFISFCMATLTNGAVQADATDVTIYSSHGAGQRFGKIDPLTGVGTDIGTYANAFPFVGGVSTAFDRDGTAYAYFLEANDNFQFVGSQLATVDTSTGVTTMMGNLGPVLVAHEIALDGTMYGIQHVQDALGIQGKPYFYEVDKQTAELTKKANTEINRSMDMAFQSDGTLWAVGGDSGNELYTVDRVTGNATFQSAIQVEEGTEIMGIMFDLEGMLGTSFFSDDQQTSLYRINPFTGDATEIGSTGLSNTHGGDILPTPATLLNDLRGALENMDIPSGISTALAVAWHTGPDRTAPSHRPEILSKVELEGQRSATCVAAAGIVRGAFCCIGIMRGSPAVRNCKTAKFSGVTHRPHFAAS